VKEGDPGLHVVVSDSVGALVQNVLGNLDLDEQVIEVDAVLKQVFVALQLTGKAPQSGAGLCLTKILQNSPVNALRRLTGSIIKRIQESLGHANCKCQQQLLESVIALVLAVSDDFAPFLASFMPLLIDQTKQTDWNVKKTAIDVVYTLASMLKPQTALYKRELLQVLKQQRFEKVKPVRDAASEALIAVQQLPGDSIMSDPDEDNTLTYSKRSEPATTLQQLKR